MIRLDLNPAQAQKLRPQSASLRTPRGDPSFNRMRSDGQATPRLAPKPEAPPGEEEPWLFSFERNLSTADVWKMGVRAPPRGNHPNHHLSSQSMMLKTYGANAHRQPMLSHVSWYVRARAVMQFSRVIVFGAHHWAVEETAATELSEAFRSSTGLKGLDKEKLETIIAPVFLGGDVLLAVQCTQLALLPEDERKACIARVAKLIDCVSSVWTQYDEMGSDELGAVVVVLEGFGEAALNAEWPDGMTMSYPVTPLDEELSVFFKDQV